MADQNWMQPMQAVDIAPEKKRRFPWLTPTTIFIVSIIGYILDGLNGTPGKVFNLIGLIALLLGFVMLVEITVASGIHKKFDKRQMLIGWLLLVATIVIGIYI